MCEPRGMDIEAIRIELAMPPQKFADALGVSKGYASDLRTKRRKPSLRILSKLETLTGRKFVAAAVKVRIAGPVPSEAPPG